ncbi:MAG TPA: response regulator [Verrucomicrobiae bacterium]|nr:response regulator [Verrucomicrobiae bacterium]
MSEPKLFDITSESLVDRPRAILVLEDDVDFGEMLKVFLESKSFEVVRVTDGVEGLRKIMARDFDLVICDLNMPNLPGDKFFLAVERARKEMTRRFIFMTGHASDSRWAAFLSKVSGPVLQKPFTLQDVLSTIQTRLAILELGGE